MHPAEQQMQFVYTLRSRGVTNAEVLKAMEATPRGDFLEGIFRERAFEDTQRAGVIARRWAGDAPLLFGGDVNLRRVELPGLTWLGGNHVDHFFGHGAARVEVLERGPLSDHPPVRVTL